MICNKNRICLFVCVLLTLLNGCCSFNLDTASPQEYKGPRAGSYYGYSVAMLKTQTEKWILVGAPRDNSTYLPNVTRPGAIYKVTLDDKNTSSIREILVDDKNGNDVVKNNGSTHKIIHGRDNQWLGVSMDVKSNRGIMVHMETGRNIPRTNPPMLFLRRWTKHPICF